ncbi:hypothetical protein BDN70DRAFT_996770 [Pholiota conissans]|uniref:Transmembrane protein n=1 Tax=Pholiota conissans TaxID=109636 RepID=A0A9P5YTN4_9AGAR|nr:hypothetical protein BDN70DRAFT_996770 [Pholiota conissans]
MTTSTASASDSSTPISETPRYQHHRGALIPNDDLVAAFGNRVISVAWSPEMLTRIQIFGWSFATLRIYRSFFSARKFLPTFPQDPGSHCSTNEYTAQIEECNNGESDLDCQWRKVSKVLKKEWIYDSAGCALFLPISVSLLQIDSVSENIFGRTAAIAGFLFACAGVLLSATLILRFSQKYKDEWMKASESLDDLESVKFWSLVAFPRSCLLWSMMLCSAAVLMLAWTAQNGSLFSNSNSSMAIAGSACIES